MLAVLLIVFGLGLAAWGILRDAGLPKWPILLTMVAAGALFVLSLLGPRLRNLAYIVPFAILPVLSLYALFLGIVPQLGGR